ncbi:MAG: 4-hydroxybenzoate octaprenyltransferase [Nitrospira bacterium HGW-Nitrospira-1]|nr:MAG: 4-hydroxybenzoate octaprenyltransferase [Nitrospira bacterium HGW-Nitrospira-1]
MNTIINKISVYLRMIKFPHSVFALPFAFTSAVIAASGIPDLMQIVWIAIAMVGARSGAMGLNRIIDRQIDSANPRTSGREIPRCAISVFAAVLLVIVSFIFLALAAYMLNPLCLKLSPVAIAVLIIYSYTKRFTWMSHFVLGLAISAAPLGAWMAVKGSFDIEIIPLGAAVIFWLAGFDVLYALQDIDFDRKYGLYSIPKRFGVRKSIYFSKIFHITSFLLLVASGVIFKLGGLYWTGMFLTAGLFLYEHSLIKVDDLSRLNIAFFNMNGYISMTVFIFTMMDYMV